MGTERRRRRSVKAPRASKRTKQTAGKETVDSPVSVVPARFVVARQVDVAAFFAVALDTVKGWAKAGMPGKASAYDLREIVQWLRKSGPWQPRGKIADAVGDDILLEGGVGNSPALEKLRAAKAALAELDLQERRGTLISVEKSKEIGERWASKIKRMGERLGKRYGRDATADVNDTLEECRRDLESGYAPRGDAHPHAELVDSEREAASHQADGAVGGRRSRRAKRSVRK